MTPLLRYRECAPPAGLATWVEAFWFIQTVAPSPGMIEHWVMPEASINLVFWFPGGWQQPHSIYQPILSGPSLRAFRKPAFPGEAYLGVRFLPGAGGPFLDCDSPDLASVIQPLHMAQPRWAERLADRLARANSEEQAFQWLVKELRQRASACRAGDHSMLEAAAWYRRQAVPRGLHDWGDRAGLSERQFRRRFQAAIGLSPKTFARIVRLQALVRGELLRPRVSWAALACQSGFADQAHLANEFRLLSGTRATTLHRHLNQIDHAALLPGTVAQVHGRFLQDEPTGHS